MLSSTVVPEKRKTNGYVGFASLPNQVHRDSIISGFEFTLMVVGESGLGKSTLLNSLFMTDLYQKHDDFGELNPMPKTMTIEKSTVELEEKGVRLRLTLVDTPGFGDLIDNSKQMSQVVDYIEDQYMSYMENESRVRRVEFPDSRVHACLYFIAPTAHGLRPIDAEFMKRLQDKVNLIPIIAKADTFSAEELKRFRTQLRQDMASQGIRIYHPMADPTAPIEDFYTTDMTPFAVIASNTVMEINGKPVRARKYPWGLVNIEDETYSDFSKLRALLIRNSMRDLYDNTNDVLYEKFRLSRLETIGFNAHEGNLVEAIENQRSVHEAKLVKMQEDMETMLARKVAETEQKTLDYEDQHKAVYEEMMQTLEAVKKRFEDKQRELAHLQSVTPKNAKKKI